MKRRQFLKMLMWSPVALLIPKVLNKPLAIGGYIEPERVNLLFGDGGGGYIVDKDIADELQRRFYNSEVRAIVRKYKIPKSIKQ